MGCNRHLSAGERRHVVSLGSALGVVLCGALAGCSFLIDSKAEQCSSDSDCTQFGGNPFCRSGVCSGLGPEGCVLGAPQSQSDYLNACTTAVSVPYNNCHELNLGCPDSAVIYSPLTRMTLMSEKMMTGCQNPKEAMSESASDRVGAE